MALFDFVFFFKNKSRIDAEVVLQLLAILVCSKTDGFLYENITFCNLGLCGRREKLQNVKKKTHQRLQICNEKQGFEIKKLANFYCFQKCGASVRFGMLQKQFFFLRSQTGYLSLFKTWQKLMGFCSGYENIAFCNLGLCGRREKLQNLKKNTLKTSNLQ